MVTIGFRVCGNAATNDPVAHYSVIYADPIASAIHLSAPGHLTLVRQLWKSLGCI